MPDDRKMEPHTEDWTGTQATVAEAFEELGAHYAATATEAAPDAAPVAELLGADVWPAYRGEVQSADAGLLPDPQQNGGPMGRSTHDFYIPPAPETVPPRGLILNAESGQRTTLRAIIANARVNDPNVLTGLVALTHAFGGFTATPVVGGWKDEHGRLVVEPGLSVEVSGPTDGFDLEQAREVLATVARDLGERWVHFEEHIWRAHHAQVNP